MSSITCILSSSLFGLNYGTIVSANNPFILLLSFHVSFSTNNMFTYSDCTKPKYFIVFTDGSRVYAVNGIFYDCFRNKWSWIETTTFVYALHAVKLKPATARIHI